MAIKPFHASASPPIDDVVGPLPNKRFGSPFHESETDAGLKDNRQSLSTSHRHCPQAGKDDIASASTMAPIESPEFTKGNRPNAWPPSFEKK